MKNKIIDTFLVTLITISAGATASFLAPQQVRITAAIWGGTTGLTTGISIFRVKKSLEEKIDNLTQFNQHHAHKLVSVKGGKNLAKKKADQFKQINFKQIDCEAALNWLQKQDIEVKKYYQPEEGEHIFNEISLFLGDKYNLIQTVYEQLKRNIPKGTSFQVHLASKSELEISTATQFCTKLSNYALLNTYNYNNVTKIIYASPPQQGRLINFLNGGWFEKYVFQKIINLLQENNLKFSCIVNPQITLSNGSNFELDILFLINDNPLWLECKTGDYQSYIVKYSDFKKHLSIEKENSCLIILGLPNHLTKKLTQLYEITVLNENNFLEYIELTIKGDSQEQNNNSVAKNNNNELTTIFKKAGIRPLPEIRHLIISEISQIKLPQTLIEIKKEISEKLTDISNNKIQDIINVLLQGGCFLDEKKHPIISFKDDVYYLISNDEKKLENHCLNTYKETILSFDNNYFNSPENINNFQEVVGGDLIGEIVFDF
jgi:predicted SprT family Zn-dependent metalloprotease